MSVIPPTVVAPPATPAPTKGAAPADGELAGAFAALVEALSAQMTAETETGAATGQTGAGGGTAAEGLGAEEEPDTELSLAAAGAAAVTAAWPMPPQGAVQRADAGPPALTAGAAGELVAGAEGAGIEAGTETAAGTLAGELADGLAEAGTTEARTAEPASSLAAVEAETVDGAPPAGIDDDPAGADLAEDPAIDPGAADAADEPATADAATGEPAADAAPVHAEATAAVPAGPSTTSEAASVARPAVGVNAAAPASASGEAAATSARAATPALPDQLVEVIAPLRRSPDGTHQVALQLRPDELGEVLVDVRIRGTEIALSLRADLPGTADLLRQSLAELRAELEAAGFRPGEFDVGSRTDRHPQREARPVPTGGLADRAGHTRGVADHGPVPSAPTGAAGLDLQL